MSSVLEIVGRSLREFSATDKNKDGQLTKQEFSALDLPNVNAERRAEVFLELAQAGKDGDPTTISKKDLQTKENELQSRDVEIRFREVADRLEKIFGQTVSISNIRDFNGVPTFEIATNASVAETDRIIERLIAVRQKIGLSNEDIPFINDKSGNVAIYGGDILNYTDSGSDVVSSTFAKLEDQKSIRLFHECFTQEDKASAVKVVTNNKQVKIRVGPVDLERQTEQIAQLAKDRETFGDLEDFSIDSVKQALNGLVFRTAAIPFIDDRTIFHSQLSIIGSAAEDLQEQARKLGIQLVAIRPVTVTEGRAEYALFFTKQNGTKQSTYLQTFDINDIPNINVDTFATEVAKALPEILVEANRRITTNSELLYPNESIAELDNTKLEVPPIEFEDVKVYRAGQRNHMIFSVSKGAIDLDEMQAELTSQLTQLDTNVTTLNTDAFFATVSDQDAAAFIGLDGSLTKLKGIGIYNVKRALEVYNRRNKTNFNLIGIQNLGGKEYNLSTDQSGVSHYGVFIERNGKEEVVLVSLEYDKCNIQTRNTDPYTSIRYANERLAQCLGQVFGPLLKRH